MASFFARLQANKHFRNGVPFFLFIGAGAFILKEFRTVRYDSEINIRANKFLTKEEAFGDQAEKINLKPKRSLQEDLELLNEKVDIDTWENIRGPRPWETPEERGALPDRRRMTSVKEVEERK
jgi:cytochrome c oxidase assembly protein subunit 16